MLNPPARTQAWLADLAAVIAELDANALPSLRPTRKRARNLKPVWEE